MGAVKTAQAFSLVESALRMGHAMSASTNCKAATGWMNGRSRYWPGAVFFSFMAMPCKPKLITWLSTPLGAACRMNQIIHGNARGGH